MKRARKLTTGLLCFAAAACGGDAGRSGNHEAAGDSPAAASEPAADRRTVAEALAASADHREFVRLLETTGLAGTFRGAVPYTVFAPGDAAFVALPEDVRTGLESDERRERLVDRLSYHVIPGSVTVADMDAAIAAAEGGRADLVTVTGARLALSREGGTILVEDASGARARITAPDLILANGVVHGIDTVLTPSG